MPYTGDPANVPTDRVRFLVGDTDNAELQLTDAEVAHLLAQANGQPDYAAPLAADALAARYAHRVNYTAGRVSRQWSDLANAMRLLAVQLRNSAGGGFPLPVSTAQLRETDRTDAQNTALKQPQFLLEQMDNPEATHPARVSPAQGDPSW